MTDGATSAARRRFLRQGSAALAAFLFGGASGRLRASELPDFDALVRRGELLPADANGIMLPAGFRSRIVARSNEPVLPGSDYRWHKAPDGGACFGSDDGGWIYVSNSERRRRGGVGAIRFDAAGDVVDAYPILERSDYNCAGGRTPWNTWLSCEEVRRGLVWECDPFGRRPAVARPALGRFEHEAVAVDPVEGYLYLTEDVEDGGLYRYRPARGLPDLDNGVLEIACVVARGGANLIDWQRVPDPLATRRPTRHQVAAATPFNGGEGIAWSDGIVYFATKGDDRVWSYDCAAQTLAVLYDAATSPDPVLTGVDNLTITPAGDVLVAEDGGDMQLVLLMPEGRAIPALRVLGQDESELCGPAFSPRRDRLYFSSQTGPKNRDRDGITYEIAWA